MSSLAKNPYANNSQLSTLEQDVLWEYAKLNDKIKRISKLAKETAERPNDTLLAECRELEKKMGLVLTLYKASVWAVLQDNELEREARVQAQRQAAMDRERQQEEEYGYESEDSLDQSF